LPRKLLLAILLLCCLAGAAAAQQPDDAPSLETWLDQQLARRERMLKSSLAREATRRMADMRALAALPAGRRGRARALLEIVRRTPPRLLAGTVLDTRLLRLTSLPAIGPVLARARMVHVAESHDQAGHHRLQAQVIDLLGQYPGRTAVGLEMFHRRSQPVLDRYTARRLTEKAFLKEVDWKKTWGFAWKLYAPILRTARRYRMPLVGLNIPRSLIRQVSRHGLDKLPANLRKQLPRKIKLDDDAHRKSFFAMMGGHPGADRARMERYYQSMCVWDATMADTAARFLKSHPEIRRMVVIAGSGHLAFGHGIPDRAARRGAGPYVIVVPRTADSDRVDTARADILRPPGRYVVFTR